MSLNNVNSDGRCASTLCAAHFGLMLFRNTLWNFSTRAAESYSDKVSDGSVDCRIGTDSDVRAHTSALKVTASELVHVHVA